MISCLSAYEVCYITAQRRSGIPAVTLDTNYFLVPQACET